MPPTLFIRAGKTSKRKRAGKKILLAAAGLIAAAIIFSLVFLIFLPARNHWPDRRPIGILFLASDGHVSPTNPRGWFNDTHLDFTGANGAQRLRRALLNYADRSIEVLKRAGAQGVIVWDLEGEEYPHKTTFIGDPRLLRRLSPEMAAADEFFARLRAAGLRVGLTIRPQQLIFNDRGWPRQKPVFNVKRELLEKIDYAQKRWGATLFYIDSNDGFWRPDEVWQLRSLAQARPDVLLIPEHTYLPYWAFSAPYVSLRKGEPAATARWAHKFFPDSFCAVDISDATADLTQITAAQRQGDILLFRAWYENADSKLVENLARAQTNLNAPPAAQN